VQDTLLLSESEVRELVSVEEAIGIVESVFRTQGLGQVVMPPKVKLDLGGSENFSSYGSYFSALPAFVGGEFNLAGIKWGGAFSKNRNSNLPYIMATLIITDPASGLPLSIMGGTYITAIRTAATSAVGVKHLGGNGASIVSIIGAGVQGGYQSIAISKVLKLEKLRIVARKIDSAQRLCKDLLDNFGIKAEPTSKVSSVVDSDVIVTATNSKIPVLRQEWIKSGALVCAVGSNQELTDTAIQSFDKIVVDNIQQNINSGNLKSPLLRGVISEKNIYSEFGPIVLGEKKSRENAFEKILFTHIGQGSLDVATGTWVYRRAEELGRGSHVSLIP